MALAALAIHQLRLLYQERAADLKEALSRKEEDFRNLETLHRETLEALQDNTRALATLAKRLGRRLPRLVPFTQNRRNLIF